MNGIEYQIEYIPVADKVHASEYRVRRGIVGTWTPWLRTPQLHSTLKGLGFGSSTPSLVHDATFEACFGRGEIILTTDMVRRLANRAGLNPNATHLYSRVKRINNNLWTLPASAVKDQDALKYLKDVISSKLP